MKDNIFNLKTVLLTAGIIFFVVLSGLIFHAVRERHVTKEAVLHLIGSISAKESEMSIEFGKFKYFIRYEYELEDVITRSPPNSLQKLFAQPVTYKDCGVVRERDIKYLFSGRDPWGTPFFYEVKNKKTSATYSEFTLTVRSFGANGRDDRGGGDDLQKIIIGYYLHQQ